MSYLVLAFLWAIFYFTHSIFASLNFKQKMRNWLGKAYVWYRLLYSLFSTVLFLYIIIYASAIEKWALLAVTDMTTYIGFMLAALGTIILVKAFKNFSTPKFVGLKPHDDLEDKGEFIYTGIHSYIRHPIYTGLILIFLGYFFYQPFMASLVHFICLLIYLPFGIYFEEKKLIAVFGEKYEQYKKNVPSLIPRITKKAT